MSTLELMREFEKTETEKGGTSQNMRVDFSDFWRD